MQKRASRVAQQQSPPAMQEAWVQSLGQEDPPEKEMATQSHSGILDWEIPWTEEPGVLQFMGLQTLRHVLATKTTVVDLFSNQKIPVVS